MVDKSKTETFAERFDRLRGGMSYQALADGIQRKTGVQITPQALHKWSQGGAADPKNAKATAEFFGVTEAYFMFGTGAESSLSLEEVLGALPAEERERTVDFIRYQLERASTETSLFAEDPARLGTYLKFIDRLVTKRKEEK